MTHPSDHVTRQPDHGLGWATPEANAPQTRQGTGQTPTPPVTASPNVPQDAAIAQQRLRATLSEQQDDRHRDDQGRGGPEADQDTPPGDETAARNCDEMVYLRIQWAETTRYEADISVNPYATNAELFTEIAKIPDALRRTLDVGDGHIDAYEMSISVGNTVTDWGDVADRVDESIAESPSWPQLNAALSTAAADGYDVAAGLALIAAQGPLPTHNPAGELYSRLIGSGAAEVVGDTGPAPSRRRRAATSRRATAAAPRASPRPASRRRNAMDTVERDVHSTYRPAVIEQMVRWAILDRPTTGDYRFPEDDAAMVAAGSGGSEEFRAALTKLVNGNGPWASTRFMRAALHGNVDALPVALEGNQPLLALARTVGQRAEGRDVAEIASADGLRVSAEALDTGARYETRILIEDTPGRPNVLASGVVDAPSAIEAIQVTMAAEHALGGLEQNDMQHLQQQANRAQVLQVLQRLTEPPSGEAAPGSAEAKPTGRREALVEADNPRLTRDNGWTSLDRHPSWNTDVTPEARGRDTVTAVAGAAATADARWPALAAALDRAVATGWDWATELSQITSSPLPERAAANELYYRLLDAHPAAALTPSATSGGDHGTPPPGPSAHHPPPTPAPAVTVDRGSPGR